MKVEPATISGMRNRLTETAHRLREHTARIERVIAALDGDLADRRFVASSDGGLVEAEADHRARLVDIRMSRTGLTRTRGAELGHQVVEAVNRVRATALGEYRAEVRARLAG